MRKSLLILISFFAIVSCGKNDSADLSKENNLNKQKELLKSLGFDLNKVTIHTDTTGRKFNKLEFNSIEEAKNYFKDLNRPHIANVADTLNMLSKYPKDFNNYIKNLVDKAKANKARTNTSPKMSTTSIDYSQYNGFTDEEVDNLDAVYDDVELTAPDIDYDPTVDTWRYLNDYSNNVFSGHKGTARIKKRWGWLYYHLDFDWDFSANVPLVSNVDVYINGVTLFTQVIPHTRNGDFWNWPGSALIYFHTYADIDYNIQVEDIGSLATVPLEIDGFYNTNTGRYWVIFC